jgi:cytochrome P450
MPNQATISTTNAGTAENGGLQPVQVVDRATPLPPGPRLPALLQATLLAFRTIPYIEYCRRKYGDTFTIRFAGGPDVVSFTHPDAIRQIFAADADTLRGGESNAPLGPLVGLRSLLLLDGERHLQERRLLMPPFHGERMHAYAPAMQAIADRTIDEWRPGDVILFYHHMQRLTLDIIMSTIFGFDEDGEHDALRERLQRLVHVAANPLWLLPPFRIKLGPITPWAKLVRTQAEVASLLYAEFARRRAAGCADRSDILSMLLCARYEDGRVMSDEELRDEMLTLLLAGHETTATALGWTLYHVLRHPDVLERIRMELDEVVGSEPLRADQLPRLELLDAAIKESMRLNPVLDDVGRLVKAPIEIGGWCLPAGVIASAQIYLCQHRDDIWPDPYRFDPDRFCHRRVSPYEFFPFGGGGRRCIGMAFALYEMKVVLARVFARTQLRIAPGYTGYAVRRAVTLAPARGLPVVVDARL